MPDASPSKLSYHHAVQRNLKVTSYSKSIIPELLKPEISKKKIGNKTTRIEPKALSLIFPFIHNCKSKSR
jgi:hypothetical protein